MTMAVSIPQIENGKLPLQPLNVIHIPWLPTDTPYGNLSAKGMNIVRRIDRVNVEIMRVYSSYVHPKNETTLDPLQDVVEHQFYQEQIVYWLRKTADELIGLAFVISNWKNNKAWPQKIEIDSISGLKSSAFSEINKLFAPHKDFLLKLNEVSNAFKHSFINTNLNVVGAEYPVVYALALHQNKLSNTIQFHSVSFTELVNSFSHFYRPTLKIIQTWADEAAKSLPNNI